ncbi:hypothetical protein NEAUS05_0994 [Nematocida ausubeli]|nr:hypothetical protein NEAUS05_0994 [Nematocida ausubeli]
MKGKQRNTPFRRESPPSKNACYDNFMTQKEKDFVASLFERTIRKKERVCPDFYTQERVPRPDWRKKESSEEESLFEGVLGMAIRKSTKKSVTAKDKNESSRILIKKLISRGKIEEIYDMLNFSEIFIDAPEKEEGASHDSADPNSTNVKAIAEKLKEIGEDLFNMEKGMELINRLLFTDTGEKKAYFSTILSIIVDRIKYIYYTPELGDYISKLVPVIKEPLSSLELTPHALAGLFLTNTVGILMGHMLLASFRKDHPELFNSVCKVLPEALNAGCISRIFLKVPHPLVWRFLAVSSRKMPTSELLSLRKRLDAYITADLNKRSPAMIENIRTFLKRCA